VTRGELAELGFTKGGSLRTTMYNLRRKRPTITIKAIPRVGYQFVSDKLLTGQDCTILGTQT
jgi:hypothetical protein